MVLTGGGCQLAGARELAAQILGKHFDEATVLRAALAAENPSA